MTDTFRVLVRLPHDLKDRLDNLPAVRSKSLSRNRVIVEAIEEYVGGEGGLTVTGPGLAERLDDGFLCLHGRVRSVCPHCLAERGA